MMKSQIQHYPGIKKIYTIDPSNIIEGAMYYSLSGIEIIAPYEKKEIDILGEPTLSVATEIENNGQIETATIIFKCFSNIPLTGVCFLVECVSGSKFLIGTKEKYPYTQSNFNTGTTSGETQIRTYEVKFKAKKACLECEF